MDAMRLRLQNPTAQEFFGSWLRRVTRIVMGMVGRVDRSLVAARSMLLGTQLMTPWWIDSSSECWLLFEVERKGPDAGSLGHIPDGRG